MKVASELLMKLSGTSFMHLHHCWFYVMLYISQHTNVTYPSPPHLLNAFFLKVADQQIPIQIGAVSKSVQF